MERYLEGEEISHDETVSALKQGVTEGHVFPVTCGAATRNLGINRLLDALVEDLRREARQGRPRRRGARAGRVEGHGRVRLQDAGRPVRRPREPLPRLPGRAQARLAGAQLPRAREGAHRPAARAAGQGDRARRRVRPRRHRRRGEAEGDPPRRARREGHGVPAAAHRDAAADGGVRHRGEGEGDEEKMGQALRRLQEEDPTIDFHRDSRPASRSSPGSRRSTSR